MNCRILDVLLNEYQSVHTGTVGSLGRQAHEPVYSLTLMVNLDCKLLMHAAGTWPQSMLTGGMSPPSQTRSASVL